MSKARIYARNLAANWIGHGASLVVMFFLSPFIVHTIGTVEFGIWSLLNVFTGYMGIFDLGVRASTGRYIILYLGKEDHEAVDQTVRTGLGFFSAISALIVGVAVVLGWFFPHVFSSLPREYYGLVRILLPIISLSVLLSAYAAIFSSVLIAHDRFDIARSVDIIVLIVRTVGTILALTWGYGIVGLTVVLVGCNVVALVANRLLARRIYPRLKAWPLMLSRSRLRELFGYGVWAFVSNISVKITGQTALVLVGIMIGVSDVTTYSVGAMLVYYSSTFMEHIGWTFFPPVQRSVARGEMGPARWLFFRQVRLALVFGLPVFVGFIVFGGRFIRLWMLGPKFPESAVVDAALVMAVLSASKLAYLHTVGCVELLAALGHIRFCGIIAVAEALANLALSVFFVLTFRWGVVGVAAGTLASRLLIRAFVVPWYACRKAGLNWRRFVLDIGGKLIFSAALIAGWYLLVRTLLPCESWLMFAVQVGLALVGYVPIALYVLMATPDRQRVLRILRLQPTSDY